MEKVITGLSIVIGATLGKKYFNTFDSAQQCAHKLGAALKDTNQKLKASKDVIKYQNRLKMLTQKLSLAGGANKRLALGIKETEKRYNQAKRAAKGYGMQIGEVVRQQKVLGRESVVLENKIARLNRSARAKDNIGNLRTRMFGLAGAAYAGGRMIGRSFELEDKKYQLGDVITGENREARL